MPIPGTTTAVDVIEEAERAQVMLHPARLRLLEHLREPDSAAGLARRLDLPRQRVNYHLRELESQRLVELVEERKKGSVVERVYRRTGCAYAISTAVLGRLGTTPDEVQDRFSVGYQIALASQAVRDLGTLQVAAAAAKKKLPTFALETEVRFASASQRHEFAEELFESVAALVRKYHDEAAPRGRTFRFYLGGHPRPKPTPGSRPKEE
jgi:DNA-binding transcriptional ArsR family regulator